MKIFLIVLSEIKKETRRRRIPVQSNSNNQPVKLDETDDYKDDLPQRLDNNDMVVIKGGTSKKDLRTRDKNDKPLMLGLGTTDITSKHFIGPLTPSTNDEKSKAKSQRRLGGTLGGPVVSSGLAGKRDSRTRHSRISNRSSLVTEKEEAEKTGVSRPHKSLILENTVSTICSVDSLCTINPFNPDSAKISPKLIIMFYKLQTG